jgi:putative Mn2+ efflux pump MntP
MSIIKKIIVLIIGLGILILGFYSEYLEWTTTPNDMNMQFIWFKTLGSCWIVVNVFLILLGVGMMSNVLMKDEQKKENAEKIEGVINKPSI